MHIIEYRKELLELNFSNICVLGNDNRMDYVAGKIYGMGYEVYRELESCDNNSIIIMPPPVSDDSLKYVFPNLKQGQRVYGGAVSNRFFHECELNGIDVIDYLKWDKVTALNAVLTAKGIIKEAEGIKSITSDSRCLVTGYGFCGKALLQELKNITCNLTAMVRRKDLKSEIQSAGYDYLNIKDDSENLGDFEFIFNTVPAMILDSDKLKSVTKNTIILDIASSPGGTDFEFCKANNIIAKLSLGIPGKLYPKEAGEIIADAIINHINSI